MKNILLLLLVVAVSFSFSCSSGNKSSSKKNGNKDEPTWSTLDYHYKTGSVSPEYYYHYKVLINSDKTGNFIFYYSYADTGFTQESFTITDSQLKALNEAISNSKVLDGDIPETDRHPIGGSTQTVAVIIVDPNPDLDQSPRRIEVPPFPEAKYEEGLEKLYTTINSLVPSEMMMEAKNKKDNMDK